MRVICRITCRALLSSTIKGTSSLTRQSSPSAAISLTRPYRPMFSRMSRSTFCGMGNFANAAKGAMMSSTPMPEEAAFHKDSGVTR